MTRRIETVQRITLEWTGTEEAFIVFADVLHTRRYGYGLDSRDSGDATGAIAEWARSVPEFVHEGGFTYDTPEGTLLVSSSWDPFNHKGDWARPMRAL